MTTEDAKKNSNEKVQAIQTLCKQLEIVLTAEQVITEGGIIKMMVYYNDVQKYDIDDTPVTKQIDEEQIKKEDIPGESS